MKKKYSKFQNKRIGTISAFSLLELMFSIVAVSLVIAAATPIVSYNLNGDIALSLQKLSSECDSIQPDKSCRLCLKNKNTCVVCDKTCSSPEKREDSTCTCKE